jgi:methylglyoxal synthase
MRSPNAAVCWPQHSCGTLEEVISETSSTTQSRGPGGTGATRRRIALVAHDHKKDDLCEWARYNRETLAQHSLFATGSTGRMLAERLKLPVTLFQSGPLGGDQQIGSRITEGDIDLLVFFWDPLESQPHDPDVKALVRIAVVWNIPIACNRSSADFIISSPLLNS